MSIEWMDEIITMLITGGRDNIYGDRNRFRKERSKGFPLPGGPLGSLLLDDNMSDCYEGIIEPTSDIDCYEGTERFDDDDIDCFEGTSGGSFTPLPSGLLGGATMPVHGD